MNNYRSINKFTRNVSNKLIVLPYLHQNIHEISLACIYTQF